MKLYQNTINGLRHKHWTRLEAIAYFIKGVARELHIAPVFFLNCYASIWKKRWLRRGAEGTYFDFGVCKLPDVSASPEKMAIFLSIFEDTLFFPCFMQDNYDKSVVEVMDKYMGEGPYGYTDGAFDVSVKQGDVVIDAGAWIGDFSAYAAGKGAQAYAFEPVRETFDLLHKTAALNKGGAGEIIPVQKGLSDKEGEIAISINAGNSGANTIVHKGNTTETIGITTLDKFVAANNVERVDFIKADIEGAERDMLRGAANVLRQFAPKLAICTYHLPDDPETLERIIRQSNPDYTVIQLRHKLFAAVVK
jgi:FkbM family methyltransferase